MTVLHIYTRVSTTIQEDERSSLDTQTSLGIEKANARGVYTGRKKSMDIDRVMDLRSEGKGATEIARTLGIGRASVYRVLREANLSHIVV